VYKLLFITFLLLLAACQSDNIYGCFNEHGTNCSYYKCIQEQSHSVNTTNTYQAKYEGCLKVKNEFEERNGSRIMVN